MNIEHLFTYHAPSPGQIVKYEQIKAHVRAVSDAVTRISGAADMTDATPPIPDYGPMYQAINESTRALAQTMVDLCPPGADLSAAVRCVRLVRNACNEFVVVRSRGSSAPWLLDIARAELLKARWQANAAIALSC